MSDNPRLWKNGYTKNELWLYERFVSVINIPFVSRSCTHVFRFKYVLEGIFHILLIVEQNMKRQKQTYTHLFTHTHI